MAQLPVPRGSASCYAYEGVTARMISKALPNGQTETRSYGSVFQDLKLQRITHSIGAVPLSEYLYGHDLSAGRITTWSQQAGAQPPSLHSFGYDAVNQLLSVTVTNAGSLVNTFGYSYDPLGNRLSEQIGTTNQTATYNALNQLSTATSPGNSRTNEWDALDRLVAVSIGNQLALSRSTRERGIHGWPEPGQLQRLLQRLPRHREPKYIQRWKQELRLSKPTPQRPKQKYLFFGR
jgi:YD repeat-containing protein